jgi:hypothetical protein
MQEIVFTSVKNAEAVRNELFKLLGKYKTVAVNDYLNLAGTDAPYSYTNETIGWSDLGDIPIARTKEAGFVLELPEPRPLREVSSAFPFLKGWWVVVDVPDDQTYEGWLVDEIGDSMILRTEPSQIQLGIQMNSINKIDAYRKRPTPSE